MSRPPDEITLDGFPKDTSRVHSFSGTEALSEAYSFDDAVTAPAGAAAREDARRTMAVTRYQHQKGLPLTGIVDAETREALERDMGA